jgi:hypothetical protein
MRLLNPCLWWIRNGDEMSQHSLFSQIVCLGDQVVPAILEKMGADPIYDSRLIKMLPWFKNANDTIIPKLLPRLNDPCPFIRLEVYEALQTLGQDSVEVQDALGRTDVTAYFDAVLERLKKFLAEVLAAPGQAVAIPDNNQ